ncbi:MAG: helix-turn-helix domain-containing protein, partial [Pseudomonadota bacterium]
MARPIEIDREQAFRSARDLFWRRGYRATSLSDLLDATAMGKGSFYAAFQSKEALFRATLAWYRDRAAAAHRRIRESKRGLSALREVLESTLLEVSSEERRRGCLLVNSVLELEGVEPELHEIATRYLSQLEEQCTSYLDEARTLG